MTNTKAHEVEREISPQTVETGALSILTRSEIDQQIATAHKFPRSLKKFKDEALQMVTLNERIAEECIYSLPRGDKTITGPSARFAEIIASAWGNCRAGARVVNEGAEFITAQGVFHDLERNVAIAYEVQRRITDSKGRRYGADMVGVTGNAASSIALRNAILKGVPKAFWVVMYDAARATIMGDFETLANRRAEAFKQCQAYGLNKEQVCAILNVKGQEDIGLEQMLHLKGLLNAIQDGDTTVEQLLANVGAESGGGIKMPERKKESQPDSKEPAAGNEKGSGEDAAVEWKVVDMNGELIANATRAAKNLVEGGAIELLGNQYKIIEVDRDTMFVAVRPIKEDGGARDAGQDNKGSKGEAGAAGLPEHDGTIASAGMQKQVSKALERAGKTPDDLEVRYGVPLNKLPAGWVNDALSWLR